MSELVGVLTVADDHIGNAAAFSGLKPISASAVAGNVLADIKRPGKRVRPSYRSVFQRNARYGRAGIGIDEKTTLKTWTIMETLVGGVGFIVALIISFFA